MFTDEGCTRARVCVSVSVRTKLTMIIITLSVRYSVVVQGNSLLQKTLFYLLGFDASLQMTPKEVMLSLSVLLSNSV